MITLRVSGKRDETFIALNGITGISGNTLEMSVKRETGLIKTVDLGGPGDWEGKHLSDVIGKEPADKILKNEKGVLKGEGLKVGGEGKIKLYDQIFVQFLNKYTKKWGGRVGETEIATGVENIREIDKRLVTPEILLKAADIARSSTTIDDPTLYSVALEREAARLAV